MRYSVSRATLRDGFSVLPELIRFGLKIVPGTIADGMANQAGVLILGGVGNPPGAWCIQPGMATRLQICGG